MPMERPTTLIMVPSKEGRPLPHRFHDLRTRLRYQNVYRLPARRGHYGRAAAPAGRCQEIPGRSLPQPRLPRPPYHYRKSGQSYRRAAQISAPPRPVANAGPDSGHIPGYIRRPTAVGTVPGTERTLTLLSEAIAKTLISSGESK